MILFLDRDLFLARVKTVTSITHLQYIHET